MSNNILIIGSTGNLGDKLFKYCIKNRIYNLSITAFRNKKKLYKQKNYLNNKDYFCLNSDLEIEKFIKLIKIKKFKIILMQSAKHAPNGISQNHKNTLNYRSLTAQSRHQNSILSSPQI